MKIVMQVELPDELAHAFLQTVRNFDLRHDPRHEGTIKIQQLLECDWPAEQMQAMLQTVMPTAKMFTKKCDS